MIVLFLSDTHDQPKYIEQMWQTLEEKQIRPAVVIHCGDLVHPEMLAHIKQKGVPTYYAMGNNEEGLEEQLMQEAQQVGVEMSLDVGAIEVDGKRIAFTHLPRVAESLVGFGSYDVVAFGHTHRKYLEERNGCILLNPGDMVGRHGDPSVALYDTQTSKVEFIELPKHTRSYHFATA